MQFSCRACTENNVTAGKFLDDDELETHIRAFHLMWTPYTCCYCDMKASGIRNLQTHCIATHFGRPFKVFFHPEMRKINQLESMKQDNNTRRHPYSCPQCEAQKIATNFETRDKLLAHIREHLGVRPFICIYCSMASSCWVSMANHVRGWHPGEETRMVIVPDETADFEAQRMANSSAKALSIKMEPPSDNGMMPPQMTPIRTRIPAASYQRPVTPTHQPPPPIEPLSGSGEYTRLPDFDSEPIFQSGFHLAGIQSTRKRRPSDFPSAIDSHRRRDSFPSFPYNPNPSPYVPPTPSRGSFGFAMPTIPNFSLHSLPVPKPLEPLPAPECIDIDEQESQEEEPKRKSKKQRGGGAKDKSMKPPEMIPLPKKSKRRSDAPSRVEPPKIQAAAPPMPTPSKRQKKITAVPPPRIPSPVPVPAPKASNFTKPKPLPESVKPKQPSSKPASTPAEPVQIKTKKLDSNKHFCQQCHRTVTADYPYKIYAHIVKHHLGRNLLFCPAKDCKYVSKDNITASKNHISQKHPELSPNSIIDKRKDFMPDIYSHMKTCFSQVYEELTTDSNDSQHPATQGQQIVVTRPVTPVMSRPVISSKPPATIAKSVPQSRTVPNLPKPPASAMKAPSKPRTVPAEFIPPKKPAPTKPSIQKPNETPMKTSVPKPVPTQSINQPQQSQQNSNSNTTETNLPRKEERTMECALCKEKCRYNQRINHILIVHINTITLLCPVDGCAYGSTFSKKDVQRHMAVEHPQKKDLALLDMRPLHKKEISQFLKRCFPENSLRSEPEQPTPPEPTAKPTPPPLPKPLSEIKQEKIKQEKIKQMPPPPPPAMTPMKYKPSPSVPSSLSKHNSTGSQQNIPRSTVKKGATTHASSQQSSMPPPASVPSSAPSDKCRKCGFEPSRPEHRKNHIYRQHLELPVLQCTKCAFFMTFRDLSYFRNKHTRKVHPESPELEPNDLLKTKSVQNRYAQLERECFPSSSIQATPSKVPTHGTQPPKEPKSQPARVQSKISTRGSDAECRACGKKCVDGEKSILCDYCSHWIHADKCSRLNSLQFHKLSTNAKSKYKCPSCVGEDRKKVSGQ